jgi:hypothetical protein
LTASGAASVTASAFGFSPKIFLRTGDPTGGNASPAGGGASADCGS